MVAALEDKEATLRKIDILWDLTYFFFFANPLHIAFSISIW